LSWALSMFDITRLFESKSSLSTGAPVENQTRESKRDPIFIFLTSSQETG
jgi:hypothetical protein